MTKTKKLKVRLVFLQMFSFIVCIAPIGVAVFINRNDWFGTPQESVKIGIGAIIAAVLIGLKALGKLHMPRRIVVFAIVFAMTFLLKSILDDLMLLSGRAFLGEALDLVFFQTAIRRTREQLSTEKTAEATAENVERIFDKFVGSGRT